MSEAADKQFELKAYLLGKCKELAEIEKIEEKLMLDEDYFQDLLLEEDQLIEDYVDDELTVDEREAFENHFLISNDRRIKTRHAKLLKDYDENNAPIIIPEVKEVSQKKWYDFLWGFSSPVPVGLSILMLIGISSLLLWIFYFSKSDSNQSVLSSLNKAYSAERPLESRISELDYAPFIRTRGQDEVQVNLPAQSRAERISLDEVEANPTTDNEHSLARVYLAKKEFEKASGLLEDAYKKSPQNLEILNDLGVLYLEKSRVAAKDEEKLTSVANALEYFDKAISIDQNFLPARFNKAMATEVYLPNRAKEAWEDYLKLDQTSKWADEARAHLEVLNKKVMQDISSPEDLEMAFIKAYQEQDDNTAFQIVSQNRELINEKYLPQRFAMTLVNKKKTIKNGKSSS